MSKLASVALVALVTACTSRIPYVARPAPQLPADVTERGEPIYRGRVYPQGSARQEPLYVYERRVDDGGDATVATHVTRDLTGRIAIAESARHARDYTLAEYTLHANQLGQSGSVSVADGRVTFRLATDGGRERVARERLRQPVVVGPTLVGYIAHRLGALRAGRTLDVRFAILDRLETIPFELERVRAKPGQTRVRMRAASWLVRLVVEPTYFTFDDASGKLVTLDGRVPPKVHVGRWWKDLDAHVVYDYVAAAYR